METEVAKLCEEIINYQNEKKKNWHAVFRELASKYVDKDDSVKFNKLLTKVVSKLTVMGYDINDLPFYLSKYK